jgi:hydrogenase maturation protein HypF
MTSGNRSDEPIAHDDEDAATRLGPMVDGLLSHDRPIHIRCDDSVIRATGSRLQLLRRSRGYAPEPLPLPFASSRSVLALGGELKSTIAVARGGEVVASHHIGDLEHLATYQSFLQAVDHLPALAGIRPDVVAHDLHPEYLSTKFALELDLPAVAIQHHHAHVAACMVEHGRTEPVLGLAFDGLGYGTDGTLWGGEFLVAGFEGFRRVGHLRAQPMPGGAQAIREPWRMAAVWSRAAGLPDAPALDPIDPESRSRLLALAASGGVATTTSMGRLFDAVAVLVGCRARVSYEAQSAIELEALARSVDRADAAVYEDTVDVVTEGGLAVVDPVRLVARVVEARARRSPAALVAACFHETIGRAAADLAVGLARAHGVDAVVLTGGVFQNVRLTEVVETEVARAGLSVLVHEQVPPNDGGLSIGQAAIAAHPAARS